jgi:oligopeptide/dipeptide ABC transporter ATP-binding protein
MPRYRRRSVSEAVLHVDDLSVAYAIRGERGRTVRAVQDVSLTLARGEALGLVGESGCGKTSFARALVGLEPSTGTIVLGGEQLAPKRTRQQARRVQIVFQDPYASLNPRMTVGSAIGEMLRVHRLRPKDAVPARVRELAELVGLPARALGSRPAGLSGGQRQRVAIARALALEPDVLVADEPTTALDVSVQAVILDLFAGLRAELGLGLLLITHNIGVVGAVCDRIAVMYLGRIVEEGPTQTVLADPRHPYTRRLFSAVPRLGEHATVERSALAGDPPDPSHIPSGCSFHPRCPEATEHCSVVRPQLTVGTTATNGASAKSHLAACHYAWQPAPTAQSPGAPGQEGV